MSSEAPIATGIQNSVEGACHKCEDGKCSKYIKPGIGCVEGEVGLCSNCGHEEQYHVERNGKVGDHTDLSSQSPRRHEAEVDCSDDDDDDDDDDEEEENYDKEVIHTRASPVMHRPESPITTAPGAAPRRTTLSGKDLNDASDTLKRLLQSSVDTTTTNNLFEKQTLTKTMSFYKAPSVEVSSKPANRRGSIQIGGGDISGQDMKIARKLSVMTPSMVNQKDLDMLLGKVTPKSPEFKPAYVPASRRLSVSNPDVLLGKSLTINENNTITASTISKEPRSSASRRLSLTNASLLPQNQLDSLLGKLVVEERTASNKGAGGRRLSINNNLVPQSDLDRLLGKVRSTSIDNKEDDHAPTPPPVEVNNNKRKSLFVSMFTSESLQDSRTASPQRKQTLFGQNLYNSIGEGFKTMSQSVFSKDQVTPSTSDVGNSVMKTVASDHKMKTIASDNKLIKEDKYRPKVSSISSLSGKKSLLDDMVDDISHNFDLGGAETSDHLSFDLADNRISRRDMGRVMSLRNEENLHIIDDETKFAEEDEDDSDSDSVSEISEEKEDGDKFDEHNASKGEEEIMERRTSLNRKQTMSIHQLVNNDSHEEDTHAHEKDKMIKEKDKVSKTDRKVSLQKLINGVPEDGKRRRTTLNTELTIEEAQGTSRGKRKKSEFNNSQIKKTPSDDFKSYAYNHRDSVKSENNKKGSVLRMSVSGHQSVLGLPNDDGAGHSVATSSNMEAHHMTSSQLFRNLQGVSEDMKNKQKFNAGLIDNFNKTEEERLKEEAELISQERLREKLVTKEFNEVYLQKLGFDVSQKGSLLTRFLNFVFAPRGDRKVMPSGVIEEKDATKKQLLNTSSKIDDKTILLMEHKFILYPESKFRVAWDLLLVFFLFYLCLMEPVNIAFQESIEWSAFVYLDWVTNIIFLFDIILSFFTAFKVKGMIITSYRLIALNYVNTWLFLDCIGSFPYDVFDSYANAVSPNSNLSSYIKLLRLLKGLKLLRIFRLGRIFTRFEDSLHIQRAFLQMTKVSFWCTLVLHAMSCIYWYIVSSHFVYGDDKYFFYTGLKDPWLPVNMNVTEGLSSVEPGKRYAIAFEWTMRVCTSIGRNLDPRTLEETIFSLIAASIGLLLWSLIIGAVQDIFDAEDKGDFTNLEKMDKINAFLKLRDIPRILRYRINSFYLHQWRQNAYSIDTADSLLNKLHPSLSMELNLFLHRPLLSKVTLFAHIVDIECIILILEMIKMRVCIPQEAVIYQGEIANEMYIIVKGIVSVTQSKEFHIIELAKLRDGDVFGERALLYNEVRNATVKSLTFTELLVLEKDSFLIISEAYPQLFDAVLTEVNAKEAAMIWNPGNATGEEKSGNSNKRRASRQISNKSLFNLSTSTRRKSTLQKGKRKSVLIMQLPQESASQPSAVQNIINSVGKSSNNIISNELNLKSTKIQKINTISAKLSPEPTKKEGKRSLMSNSRDQYNKSVSREKDSSPPQESFLRSSTNEMTTTSGKRSLVKDLKNDDLLRGSPDAGKRSLNKDTGIGNVKESLRLDPLYSPDVKKRELPSLEAVMKPHQSFDLYGKGKLAKIELLVEKDNGKGKDNGKEKEKKNGKENTKDDEKEKEKEEKGKL